MTSTPGVADLRLLGSSWMLSLRAERKSPQTLKNYGDGLRFYLDWCVKSDADPMARDSLRGCVAELLDAGMSPATVRARQLPVRRFSAWLVEEGETTADPFVGLTSPKLDTKVVEPLTDDELRRLLKGMSAAEGCNAPGGATTQAR